MAKKPAAPPSTQDYFTDPIFPPDRSSICFDPDNPKLDPDIKQLMSQVKVFATH